MLKRAQSTLFLLRMRNGGEKCVANHSLYHYYELYWKPSTAPANAKYFVEKRPELFAQGYESDPPPQMCYSNPELVKLVAQEARDYFDKGGYPYKVVLCNAPLGYKWGENFFCVEADGQRLILQVPGVPELARQGQGQESREVLLAGCLQRLHAQLRQPGGQGGQEDPSRQAYRDPGLRGAHLAADGCQAGSISGGAVLLLNRQLALVHSRVRARMAVGAGMGR